MNTKSESHSSKLKKGSSPPPPPPMPPLPKFSSLVKPAVKRETAVSVTKREIARYWRQKSKVEEDHLLAAIKAAAHIRLRNLLKGDSRLLEEFLAQDDDTTDIDNCGKISSQKDENNNEVQVVIKDWWKRSKYAYLNQPAIKSMDTRRASSYKPQFHCYKSTSPPATTFGIF